MVMKTERKFTWVIRYYNVMEGTITYRTFFDLTVEEAKWYASTYLEHNKNYQVSIFKLYKKF